MKAHRSCLLFYLVLLYLTLSFSQGLCFTPLLPKKAIYFQNAIYKIKEKETLVDLAVSFRLGYNALILANREYDPWIPPTGAEIILPFQILIPPNFILPLKRYILINLPEMRLYYFQENKFLVFPIGIGDEGKLPPPGFYYIKDKRVNPFWYPPESIRAEDPTLPKVVPPGPDNPLGEYALYLNKGLYAIHGTNKPHSIGRRTTHGCFRLYPEHIELLYHLTPLKTPVYIISEPYKLAIEKDIIYLQAFPDLEKRQNNPLSHIIRTLDALTVKEGLNYQINLLKLEQILENPDGLVHKIGVLKR